MADSRNPDLAPCEHERTQLIARDDNSTYVECLSCGEILEADELKGSELKEKLGFDESLSDA
jgi:hypothetical protein